MCLYVWPGGLRYAVLVCVITALSTEPKLSTVQFSSAQLSSAAQGQTSDLVSAGPNTGGNSRAIFRTAVPSGYD